MNTWLVTLTTCKPLCLRDLPALLAALGPRSTATVGHWSGATLSLVIDDLDMTGALEKTEQLWSRLASRDHGPLRLLEASPTTGPALLAG